MQNCRYNVSRLPKGGKQAIMAKFDRANDAANYAHSLSVGEFNDPDMSIKIYDRGLGKVLARYKQGRRVK